MTAVGVAALIVFGTFAVADWASRGLDHRRLELVSKPGATVALVLTAVALDPADETVRWFFVGALVCSLVGDVALLWEDRLFLGGLAAFLVAHLLYITGLWVNGTEGGALAVGAVVTAALVVPLARAILAGAKRVAPQMVVPVAGYIAVIAVMLMSAIGSANGYAIAGAGLFTLSDAMIAWRRFIRPFSGAGVAIMVTYHLGQLGLVLSLL